MMKTLLLALCIATAATAAQIKPLKDKVPPPSPNQSQSQATVGSQYVQGSDAAAPIVKSDSDVQPDGFSFNYETGNGIAAEAHGELAKADQVDFIKVKGQYSYLSPDGANILVSYTADENGYQPQSDILPVGPAVPPEIARSLEYIAQHPPQDETAKKYK